VLRRDTDPVTHLPSKVYLDIKLPAGFPEKYREAVIRTAEGCTVKRALANPPAFETTATIG
jgi:hypothetical protein